MDAAFDRLLDTMPTAFDSPRGDLAAGLSALPEPGRLPAPWTTWTLIVLARLAGRQAVAAALLREHLLDRFPTLLDRFPALDVFRADDVPLGGTLPGAPGW